MIVHCDSNLFGKSNLHYNYKIHNKINCLKRHFRFFSGSENEYNKINIFPHYSHEKKQYISIGTYFMLY